MNIRCSFCQTPYTLSRIEMIDALQEMDAQKLNHYDAHCPRCKRATPIPRQRLEMFMPKWRDELKKLEVELKEHPQQAAPASVSAPEAAPVKQAEAGPEPVPAKAKAKGDTKAKPPSKEQVGQKPAARAELGKKPPAKNTPSQGKKRNR
jgi:phage FluMu protein Com